MMPTISELYAALPADPWRQEHPFDPVFAAAHKELLKADDLEAAKILSAWLSEHQPCLFGKIAAKEGLLRFCFLREADLADEKALRQRIQTARLAWKQDAWGGGSHGFIIVLLSQRVAESAPSEEFMSFASRLCSLYLLVDIVPDEIYLDELYLELPVPSKRTKRWNVGANFFCANADGRWWSDHRIPGGMAFSMNSVGHMVESGRAKNAISELARSLDVPDEDPGAAKLTSLANALVLAMQTIKNATPAKSGPATELVPAPADSLTQMLTCPHKLPASLAPFSHCTYRGWYHTDQTLPRVYFLPDSSRPPDVKRFDLDFTYLFDHRIINPDYITNGSGLQIRESSTAESADLVAALSLRLFGEDVEDTQLASVRRALGIQ